MKQRHFLTQKQMDMENSLAKEEKKKTTNLIVFIRGLKANDATIVESK